MKSLIVLLFLVLVTGCSSPHVTIGDKSISVEVARTPEERQLGLMQREELCDNCGMLFIFEKEGMHSFWMKDTLLPLDMVFMDSDLEIVDVLHAVPCIEEPCPSYVPESSSMYVLETNAFEFEESIIGSYAEISLVDEP